MEPLTVPPVTTRAALRDETVSSGNGIGATALATLLHERCQEDWQRRFDNGAQAITMHDVSAHDETARWLAARGVHIGCDTDLAYEAGREDGAHEATLAAAHVVEQQGLALGRLRAAAQAVVDHSAGYHIDTDCDVSLNSHFIDLRAALEEAPRG